MFRFWIPTVLAFFLMSNHVHNHTIGILIQKGSQAGEFKLVMDDSQMALSIIALIEGGVMIAKVTDSQINLNYVLKTVEMLIDQMTVKV